MKLAPAEEADRPNWKFAAGIALSLAVGCPSFRRYVNRPHAAHHWTVLTLAPSSLGMEPTETTEKAAFVFAEVRAKVSSTPLCSSVSSFSLESGIGQCIFQG